MKMELAAMVLRDLILNIRQEKYLLWGKDHTMMGLLYLSALFHMPILA